MELIRTESRGVEVVEIHGKLVGEMESSQDLHGLFQTILAEGKKQLVVDLRDVPWVNSLGIGMLIGVYASVKNRGGELVFAHATERILHMLAVTRLFCVFHVFDTVDTAVEYMKSRKETGRAPAGEIGRNSAGRERSATGSA
jgi:anti-sigma B factor antagonist